MATPEFDKQFFMNMETINRFLGFMPKEPREVEEAYGICEECKEAAPDRELSVNAGVCNYCAKHMDIK